VVIPSVFIIVEYAKKKKELFSIICRWMMFWTIGIRAFTAGFMQFANPQYTMRLLSVGTDSILIIQELGFIQFAVGLVALLAATYKKSYFESALISIGIFMIGASYLHISRLSHIDAGELVSLIGDLIIVILFIVYFTKKNINKKKNIVG